MRICALFGCAVLFLSFSFAQIPNNGFETWADDGGGNVNPDGWQTSNSSPYVTVEQFTPAHQGSYAMRVKNVDITVAILPGVAFLEAPFNFTQTPSKFGAWVRSTIMQGDTAFIILVLMKGDEVIASSDSCTFRIHTSYSQYTYLEFPIGVISSSTPDSMYITVSTGLVENPQVGTELIVDELTFINPVTNVEQSAILPTDYVLEQNYPNPFNPSTSISFTLPASGWTTLRLYDLLGRETAVLASEWLAAGRHTRQWNADRIPAGVYLCRLESGGHSATRKVVLVK